MNFLPVAQRELRVLARLPATYSSRIYSAALVSAISLGMLYAGFSGRLSAGSAGQGLFLIVSLLAGMYVLIGGAFATADCLSQEKREGTLGLLFLTDLRGYDVIAGKLISRTGTMAYSLLAALPALGLGVLLGGVSGRELLHMAVALLNGLFFAASFGILVSAVSRRERRALSLGALGVLALTVFVPVSGWWLSLYWKSGAVHPWFLIWSPAGAFLQTLTAGSGGPGLSFSFLQSAGVTHLLAWSFLLAAGLILPHAWRERPSGNASAFSRALSKRNGRPGPVAARVRRRPWLDDNPVIWVAERWGEKGLGIGPLLLVFAVTCAAGWGIVRHTAAPPLPLHLAIALVLHLGLMFFLLLQACRAPAEDRRTGVLELLLTTPIGSEVYVRGRLLSLKRRFIRPLVLVLAADLGLVLSGWWQLGMWNWEIFLWIAGFTALILKLLVDLYTLSWVGFWQGLKTGDAGVAMRKAFFHVLLLRWVVLLGIVAVLGLLTGGRLFQSPAGIVVMLAGYLAVFVATTVDCCAAAMRELSDDVRRLALASQDEEAARPQIVIRRTLRPACTRSPG